MKLTQEQIDILFNFTRQHYVEYFDVQSELVDHLANAIETEWKENPKISFDEALNKEFKKFGVFGFMDVVEEKKKQLERKYNSIVWSHFKAFLGMPKIIVTVLSVFALYFFMKQIQNPKAIVFIVFMFFLGVVFYKLFENRKLQSKESKKWLFKEIIFNYGSMNGVIVLLFNISNFSIQNIERFFGNDIFIFLISAFLILLSLSGFIIFYLIPSKADEYLSKTYPEYNLEKL